MATTTSKAKSRAVTSPAPVQAPAVSAVTAAAVVPAPAKPKAAKAPIMAPVAVKTQEIPAAPPPVAIPPKSVKPQAVAAAVGQPVEKIMTFTKDQMEKVTTKAKEQFEKATTTARKSYDEMAVFGKGNVDAVVKAGAIYAKGVEEFSRAVMGLSQIHYETSMAATKAVLGATSLRQVIDVQSEFAKTAVDKTLAETTKLSELARKVATETMEPIQARVTVAVEKMSKPLAA
jgi:phasin family protein